MHHRDSNLIYFSVPSIDTYFQTDNRPLIVRIMILGSPSHEYCYYYEF